MSRASAMPAKPRPLIRTRSMPASQPWVPVETRVPGLGALVFGSSAAFASF